MNEESSKTHHDGHDHDGTSGRYSGRVCRHRDGRPTTLTTPDAFKWLKYGPYPTQHACKVEGDQIIFKENSSYIFKCVEQTKGDYFIWELYIGVPE